MISYDDRSHIYRDIVNKYCAISPFYKHKIKSYSKCYACNYETASLMNNATVLPDIPLNEKLRNLPIGEHHNAKVQLLYCGRLINKKGLLFLLDVIAAMPSCPPFELLIYGEGNQKSTIDQKIKDMKLNDRVFLKGFVQYDSISRVYNNADVFVLPSLRESGGSVLVEAMAHALPIVSLDMGLSRVMKPWNTGIFVNTLGSKEEVIMRFAGALKELIENASLRIELGHNGYQYVNSELNWDKVIGEVYGSLIQHVEDKLTNESNKATNFDTKKLNL